MAILKVSVSMDSTLQVLSERCLTALSLRQRVLPHHLLTIVFQSKVMANLWLLCMGAAGMLPPG